MKNVSRTFHLYRYQILPTVEEFQPDFYTGINNKKELIRRKNDIFADVIRGFKEFKHPRADLTHQLFEIEEFLVIKLGANRSLIRITKEFEEEELENWPSVYIVINNNPTVQLIAVELEFKAFFRSSTVVNILEANINSKLSQYKLEVQIIPMFAKNEFWQIVQTHKNRIKSVEFFMVAPNLANISKGLELDLLAIKERTNSLNTNLALNSPKGEGLTLIEEDKFVQSLVHYSSEGGGTIHLKATNIRKTIKTEDSVRSVEVDEIFFTVNDAPEQIVNVLKEDIEMIEHAKTFSLFILIGLLVNLLVGWLKSDFLSVFLSENLIILLIALVAINTTTLSVVLSKVREIADKTGGSFERTAKEMKISMIEQVVLIIVSIIIQVVEASQLLKTQLPFLTYASDVILIAILFYAVYILYDTANSIFVILKFEDEKPKKIVSDNRQPIEKSEVDSKPK